MSENYLLRIISGNYLLRIISGNYLLRIMYITLHGKVEIYRDTGVSKNLRVHRNVYQTQMINEYVRRNTTKIPQSLSHKVTQIFL